MKKLLSGLLLLGSISSYATLYNCESTKGKIILSLVDNKVSVDLVDYEKNKQLPLGFYYDDLENLQTQKSDDFHDRQVDLAISRKAIKLKVKQWDGGWGTNTLKIILNRKSKKMRIKFYNTFLILRDTNLEDRLICKSIIK